MRYIFLLALSISTPAMAAEDCTGALLESVKGTISKLAEAPAAEPKLNEGDLLESGGGFRTGPKTAVDLRLCDGSSIRVGAESEIEFEDETPETKDFLLTRGAVRVILSPAVKMGGPKLRLRSPSGSVGGRSGEFLIEVAGEHPRTTVLHVLKGEGLLGPESGWGALHGMKEQTVPDHFTHVPASQMASIESGVKDASPAEKFERAKLLKERNKGAAAVLFSSGIRATGAKETGNLYERAEAKRAKAAK
ncbi:MAG: hypothetical protein EOP11_11780 [Proteobacteria bacterium]|nr:MAG: hypothetical protein EOP11_11780 [Pseudomonadota bacterium]